MTIHRYGKHNLNVKPAKCREASKNCLTLPTKCKNTNCCGEDGDGGWDVENVLIRSVCFQNGRYVMIR